MKMCRKCHTGQKKQGGYLGTVEIVKQEECSIHPRMENWRVFRTVKTLIVWGLEPAGMKITVGAPGYSPTKVVISLGDGWVHLRNAKLQLFDYEVPFIELLLKEGMIEKRECRRGLLDADPAAVRVTMKGHTWVRERQLEDEAKKRVQGQVEFEKATL